MTYVILNSEGKYLTNISHGKTRRGWSKHIANAARFHSRDAAQEQVRLTTSRHGTLRVEETR